MVSIHKADLKQICSLVGNLLPTKLSLGAESFELAGSEHTVVVSQFFWKTYLGVDIKF